MLMRQWGPRHVFRVLTTQTRVWEAGWLHIAYATPATLAQVRVLSYVWAYV